MQVVWAIKYLSLKRPSSPWCFSTMLSGVRVPLPSWTTGQGFCHQNHGVLPARSAGFALPMSPLMGLHEFVRPKYFFLPAPLPSSVQKEEVKTALWLTLSSNKSINRSPCICYMPWVTIQRAIFAQQTNISPSNPLFNADSVWSLNLKPHWLLC